MSTQVAHILAVVVVVVAVAVVVVVFWVRCY